MLVENAALKARGERSLTWLLYPEYSQNESRATGTRQESYSQRQYRLTSVVSEPWIDLPGKCFSRFALFVEASLWKTNDLSNIT
jgi:hypothetical protein